MSQRKERTHASNEEPRQPWWLAWLVPLVVITSVWIAFRPALDAGFLNWDDDRNITANQSFRGLTRPYLAWMFSTVEMGPYQPLAWMSLAIDHALFGLTPPAYPEAHAFHRTSVAVHALGAVAFYFLALELLPLAVGAARSGVASKIAAGFAALAFALHPLRVESVAWVTERRDVLCGLFFSLSALAYLRWVRVKSDAKRDKLKDVLAVTGAVAAAVLCLASVKLADGNHLELRGAGAAGLVAAFVALALSIGAVSQGRGRSWFSACLLCFVASLLSKTLGVVLPVLFLVLDVWPLRRTARASLLELAIEKAPLFACAAVLGVIAMWGQSAQIASVVSWEAHTPVERITQCAYGLWFYLWKTIAPVHLLPIYELPDVVDPRAPRFLVAGVLVVIGAALVIAMRKRFPAIACACIAYAIAIAPVLGLFQSGPQIVADRYSYLACMPFALLCAGALWWLVERRPALRTATLGGAIVVSVVLGVATWRQSAVWKSSETLWSYTLRVNPESAIGCLNLGDVKLGEAQATADPARKRELLTEAEDLFRRGLELDQDARFLVNLAVIEGERAHLDPNDGDQHTRRALETMRAAIELADREHAVVPEMRKTLAVFLFNVGETDEGLKELSYYVGARPHDVTGLYNYGLALNRVKRFTEAVPVLERAIALAPASADLWTQLGVARFSSGEKTRGVQAVRRALELDPRNAVARSTLAGMEHP